MKNWFSTFRASMRIDAQETSNAILSDQDTGRLTAVHKRLCGCRPSPTAPDGMHERIMAAVHKVDLSPRRGKDKPAYALRFAGAGAAACAMLLAGGVLLRQTSDKVEPSESLGSIRWTQEAASTLNTLSSLDQEMEHLRSDLRATAEYFLASLP